MVAPHNSEVRNKKIWGGFQLLLIEEKGEGWWLKISCWKPLDFCSRFILYIWFTWLCIFWRLVGVFCGLFLSVRILGIWTGLLFLPIYFSGKQLRRTSIHKGFQTSMPASFRMKFAYTQQFTHLLAGSFAPLFLASLHASDVIGQRSAFSHLPVFASPHVLVKYCWLHGKVALQILTWKWLFLGM